MRSSLSRGRYAHTNVFTKQEKWLKSYPSNSKRVRVSCLPDSQIALGRGESLGAVLY